MLEYIAIAITILGIYLVIRGFSESDARSPYSHPFPEIEDDWGTDLRREMKDENVRGMPEKKTEIRGGGVILIGPIPIVFGDSKYALYALILSIVLMLLAIVFMVVI